MSMQTDQKDEYQMIQTSDKYILDEYTQTDCSEGSKFCDVCQKSISSKSGWTQHLLIHSGIKPYVCELCRKSFRQKAHLKAHMLTHTGEKPYVCDICQKSYATKKSFNLHGRYRHNIPCL